MNKAQLIKSISEDSGLSQKDTTLFLSSFSKIIKDTVANGEQVKIVDFGTFFGKTRAPKRGVNPKKPEEKINIPSKNVPRFRAGKDFKARVEK